MTARCFQTLLWLAATVCLARAQVASCTSGGCGPHSVPGRYAHCAGVFLDNMIIYGGRGFKGSSNSISTLGDTWAFDAKEMDWTLLSSGGGTSEPEPRSSHACAIVDDGQGTETAEMLVFGGMVKNTVGDSHVSNEVWKLELADPRHTGGNVVTARWSSVHARGTPPVPRFDHTALNYRQGLLIYGGCESTRAFGDVWLLEKLSSLSGDYAWRQLHAADGAHIVPPFTMMNPPLPPSAPITTNSSNAALSPLPPPPPQPSPPPPIPYWALPDPNPGLRCAHSAVSTSGGMLIFGGRIPLISRISASDEPTWQTLADAWVFDVEASGNQTSHDGWTQISLAQSFSDNLHRNRSDHSCVMRRGNLMVFGGLYTDMLENTIYIMKDFLSLILPSNLYDRNQQIQLAQMQWGPEWRFDHSMVIARTMPHPDKAESRLLEDAPLLYGGGGGMEIFADLWVYDVVNAAWYSIGTPPPTTAVNVVTSILFGTVGFALYACVIVCVFIRRLARSRGHLMDFPGAANAGGAGQAARGHRGGVDPLVVQSLPRVKWCDVVKLAGTECVDARPKGAEVPTNLLSASTCSSASGSAESSASGATPTGKLGGGSAEAEDEELCPVCLCSYESDDVLMRLPCEHLFHESCVSRWLLQDSSCPQCRFNLATWAGGEAATNPPPGRAGRQSLQQVMPTDEEAGTELVAQPIATAMSTAIATPTTPEVVPGAVAVATAVPVAEANANVPAVSGFERAAARSAAAAASVSAERVA